MRTLKIALWTVGLSLVGVLFYIGHVNRERAIRGRSIGERLRLGMSVADLEKVLGHNIKLEPEGGGRGFYVLQAPPGGIYHAGYFFLFEFDNHKKVDFYQAELTPMWGNTELTATSLQ